MSFDLCKEIRGSMTEFQKLTPELLPKLSINGLTYDELKDALDNAGLSIDNVVCDTSRVFQNAFYADYENGKYCEMYLQHTYLDKLIQILTPNFPYNGKNPLLISKNWKQYYFQSVPVPMAIYDFSRRYSEIPVNEVFSIWLSIHKRIDYSYGLWDDKLLAYVFSYAPKCTLPVPDNDGYITIYRGMGSISQSPKKAISWTSNPMNALWFANHNGCGTALLIGKVKPCDIISYQKGYSEENEVIVRPGTVSQISKEDFIPATNEYAVPLMSPIFDDFARFGTAARKLGYPVECVFQFHGIKHILRVLTLTLIYCYNSGDKLSEEDKKILIYFSLLHDYGRDSEDADDSHGYKSVVKIYKNRPGISGIKLSPKARLIAQYLIQYHSLDDETGEKAINKESKFSRRDKIRTIHLYHIAKDMDGLDRVRFCGLDYKMLRTEFGRKLPLIAGALLKEQLINLLSEHDFEECMRIIAEKQRKGKIQ